SPSSRSTWCRTARRASTSRPEPSRSSRMAPSIEKLARELAHALLALHVLLADANGPSDVLRSLGWDLPPGVEDIGLGAFDLSDLVEKVLALEADLAAGASDSTVEAEFAEVLLEVGRALVHIK